MKTARRLSEETLQSLDYAWPELLEARDPWSGDEALPDPSSYQNYLDFGAGGPQLDEAAWRETDVEFLRVYRAILDGRAPWSSIEASARSLDLLGPMRHDRRPLDRAPERVSDAALADHVEDWMPDVGLVAPDRVLGPWAEGPLPPWVRQAAASTLAFSLLVPPGVTPVDRVSRNKPKPPVPYRASLQAVALAPPMVWTREADGGLVPVLPLCTLARPVGPVAGMPGSPAALGRAVPGPEGWFLAAVLPLPAVPSARALTRRLRLELLRIRRAERRATWEDLLRRRTELLHRAAMSEVWLQLRDQPGDPWDF